MDWVLSLASLEAVPFKFKYTDTFELIKTIRMSREFDYLMGELFLVCHSPLTSPSYEVNRRCNYATLQILIEKEIDGTARMIPI